MNNIKMMIGIALAFDVKDVINGLETAIEQYNKKPTKDNIEAILQGAHLLILCSEIKNSPSKASELLKHFEKIKNEVENKKEIDFNIGLN